jgi:hypothetical protein
MRALFHTTLFVAALAASATAPFACDDTPRGEQGVDFLGPDGSSDNVPAGPDADPDAHGPCVEESDAGATCAQVSSAGVAYGHLIACTAGVTPFDLPCIENDAGASDAGTTFCCASGLL